MKMHKKARKEKTYKFNTSEGPNQYSEKGAGMVNLYVFSFLMGWDQYGSFAMDDNAIYAKNLNISL